MSYSLSSSIYSPCCWLSLVGGKLICLLQGVVKLSGQEVLLLIFLKHLDSQVSWPLLAIINRLLRVLLLLLTILDRPTGVDLFYFLAEELINLVVGLHDSLRGIGPSSHVAFRGLIIGRGVD